VRCVGATQHSWLALGGALCGVKLAYVHCVCMYALRVQQTQHERQVLDVCWSRYAYVQWPMESVAHVVQQLQGTSVQLLL
jgi:hypothetical protein